MIRQDVFEHLRSIEGAPSVQFQETPPIFKVERPKNEEDPEEELNEEDDAMVTNAHCPYCGARYELYDTLESEKKNYPYWDV